MRTRESGGVENEPGTLRERLEILATKANTGDRQALIELRKFLDDHPEIQNHVGDLGRLAESHWIELLVGNDALSKESVARQVAQLKQSLSGPEPNPIEKLVVDLVAVNHLAERQAEIAATASTQTLEQATFHLKRAESAQRRYLHSLKMLTQLRALMPQGLAPVEQGAGTEAARIYNPKRKTG